HSSWQHSKDDRGQKLTGTVATVGASRVHPDLHPRESTMLSTTTHLNFHGDARAALEFYGTVFGGRVQVTTYAELGMPADAPGADRVVFGQVEADNGFRVMAFDVLPHDPAEPAAGSTTRSQGTTVTDQPFFVSVRGAALDEIGTYWAGLAAGATVVEPLAASAWSAGFGMLTDRF